jgi:hypothetical protein
LCRDATQHHHRNCHRYSDNNCVPDFDFDAAPDIDSPPNVNAANTNSASDGNRDSLIFHLSKSTRQTSLSASFDCLSCDEK